MMVGFYNPDEREDLQHQDGTHGFRRLVARLYLGTSLVGESKTLSAVLLRAHRKDGWLNRRRRDAGIGVARPQKRQAIGSARPHVWYRT
jgi:hypothetical protein